MNVIGEVQGRRAIIVDDEIDTGGTLIEIVRALEREGVTEMYACATHGVLSDPAVDRIRDSSLREVVMTDSIPLPASKRIPKLTILSVAPLIGEAIKRIHRGESVGALFSQRGLVHPGDAALGGRRRGPLDTAGTRPGRGRRGRHDRRRPCAAARTIRRPMSLQLHRPDGDGGLEPRPVTDQDWHNQLRSPRWGGSLRSGRLPELQNPEMKPTSRVRSVLFWLALAAVTFVVLVVGYGSGFWHFIQPRADRRRLSGAAAEARRGGSGTV